MEYATASTDDIDSVVPEEYGGMWFFREPLDCENLGVTLLELESGGKGKVHDHADEGHEEVYVVVDGELTVQLGGDGDAPPKTEVTLSRSMSRSIVSVRASSPASRGVSSIASKISCSNA